MRSSYLDYAMSVIVGRALPDVRDGLKPVHRRVLFSMHESGLQPNRPYRKCANVVGGVMGNFHPHGDQAIYDTLVRLAQDFAQRYPLIDGQGNFGSIDNDPAAAMRYTEARLARLATEMLRDIDADTVDFGPNYDESHIEPLRQGKEAIIVTELPYQVTKGDGRNEGTGLIKKIAEVVHDKKIPEISDLRDESDQSGIRLVIELKRDVNPRVVLNKLYKHTPMQSTFGVNMVALVDGVPRTLNLRDVIHHYVQHQREVIVRRTKHELSQKEARRHVLEGLLIAIDNLDAVIELIRASRDRDAARAGLVEQFELSVIQAEAILALRLSQLTALETDDIKKEHADITERIAYLRDILGDELKVLGLIKDELEEIAERFEDERRTQITASEDEIDIEYLIADQQMVITITKSGYIKSLPLATYRKQHRGGVGVTGMDMKDGDYIEHLFVCSSHDFLLFFSNRGKVYRSKVYELPEAQRTAKGRALVNVLPLREGERIQSVLSTRDSAESKYLVFATKNGTVKKTEFGAYNTPINADGIIAIKIRDDDELVAVRRVDPGEEILMISKEGLAVRFEEEDARAMGRDTGGVRGMNISGQGNRVLTMDVARDDQEVLVVTENGFGKRTPVSEYRKTSRGAKGVQTIKFSERRGGLAAALVVRPHHELLFISQEGMVQRTGVRGIRQTGRSAQGVTLMNVRDDDRVSAVALVVESDAPTAAAVADGLTTNGAEAVDGAEPLDELEPELEADGELGADDGAEIGDED